MSALRAEIAALAAQFIADGGLDYQSAKRKAARDVLGEVRGHGATMPDNDEVDRCLLEHLQLFDPAHDARIRRYREAALTWMERLAAFNPYLTGAAWKGIVAEHAPVHLQLFTDEQKELEILLINDRIDFDTGEIAHFAAPRDVTALSFVSDDVPFLLSLYAFDDLRGALRRRQINGEAAADRGAIAQVRELLS